MGQKAKTNKAKAPKMSFNERVRKVIHGEAETKEKVVSVFNEDAVYGVGLDATLTPVQGLTQNNILQVLAVAQGSEQEQREGNKIQDCRLRVRGVLASRPYVSPNDATPTNPENSSTYPYEVHMVFFKLKKDVANNNQSLKVLPNNTTGIIDGTLMNSVYPYNKDRYIIRKVRVFRMRPLSSVTPASTNSQLSNARAYHRFQETIDIHKDLRFNDQQNTPANDWVGVSFFIINGDGNPLGSREVRTYATMDAVLRYKDI